jgi:PAS domain-containing protein
LVARGVFYLRLAPSGGGEIVEAVDGSVGESRKGALSAGVLHTDIDDRKRVEEALRATELNFRLIVDGIPGLLCAMSATGEVELLNRKVLEYGPNRAPIYGFLAASAVGRNHCLLG